MHQNGQTDTSFMHLMNCLWCFGSRDRLYKGSKPPPPSLSLYPNPGKYYKYLVNSFILKKIDT